MFIRLRNPAAAGFYLLSLAIGIAFGASEALSSVFFHEDLGASLTLIGNIHLGSLGSKETWV